MNRPIALLMLVALGLGAAHAQSPHIHGSWALNAETSTYPGPLPRHQIRTYLPMDDGYLLGISLTIDAQGNGNFLQFAAKPDGKDYPEYSSFDLAVLQVVGEETTATYSESPVDEYTVEWTDKRNGEAFLSGTREVSTDGQVMTIRFSLPNDQGKFDEFVLVYDKQ